MYDIFYILFQVDEVEEDGLRPACLKPAERNKNTRQTVRVSSFYESDAQTFEKKHVFKVSQNFCFLYSDLIVWGSFFVSHFSVALKYVLRWS